MQVRTLIGARDVSHGIRCLASLERYCQGLKEILIFDDGTLTVADQKLLSSALTRCRIITHQERNSHVESCLRDFPHCAQFRRENPLFQKLFDVVLYDSASEAIIYCDSDVLFFKPFQMTDLSADNNVDMIFMADDSYAYSLYPWHLCGRHAVRIGANVNTGVVVARKSKMNLGIIEAFLARTDVQSKLRFTSCWAEQTCWAVLAAHCRSALFDSGQLRLASISDAERRDNKLVGLHFVSSVRQLLHDCRDERSVETAVTDVRYVPIEPLNAGKVLLTMLSRLSRRVPSFNRL